MISGRHAATALGLRSTKLSRRVSAAVVDCQNWDWKPTKMGLSAARTANSESLVGNAFMAASAASRTFLDLLRRLMLRTVPCSVPTRYLVGPASVLYAMLEPPSTVPLGVFSCSLSVGSPRRR